MRRLLPALIATAVLTTGCEMLTPGGRTIKACRENLISNLKDRESYRQDSDPKVIQEEPDQPKVWGWYYNAKNSMGGYGDGSEVLCYQEKSGRVIQQSFGVDEADDRRLFLAITSPKIQKEISDERAALEKAKADKEAKLAKKIAIEKEKARAAAAAEKERERIAAAKALRIYKRNYAELTRFCATEIIKDMRWPTLDVYTVDLAPYRLKNKKLVAFTLHGGCEKMNETHTNAYGDFTPAPQAFERGLVGFTDYTVKVWGENRDAICKVSPKFCR